MDDVILKDIRESLLGERALEKNVKGVSDVESVSHVDGEQKQTAEDNLCSLSLFASAAFGAVSLILYFFSYDLRKFVHNKKRKKKAFGVFVFQYFTHPVFWLLLAFWEQCMCETLLDSK